MNKSALAKLDGLDPTVFESNFDQAKICKMKGCDSLDNFGTYVHESKKDSNGVRKLYKDMKFTANEVVHDLQVQLTNSSIISVPILANSKYMLPLYEMGDCPVFKVSDGLGDTGKIT